MVKKRSVNLTSGNIFLQILTFALPIMLGQIFQNLYNSVDSIVVGRFVGTTALAAVSSCSDISMLLTGFFTGLATGSTVLFARYFGAGDDSSLSEAIHTAVTFAVILGIVMAGLGIIFTPFLLTIVGCPADVWREASLYLRVYLIGILFTSIYNVGSGILRAVGDSRRPFYILVVASCVNIVADLITVVWLGMGVLGVALATICSQAISVTLVFSILVRTEESYRVEPSRLHINGPMLREVISLGIPSAVQSSLVSTSNLFVQRYINSFGSRAMAGTGAAKKIDKFVGVAASSIGQALTTFVGQNVGAKKYSRAFKGIRTALAMGIFVIVSLGIPVIVFSEKFVNIFTSDPRAVGYGIRLIRIMMPLYFLSTINQVFSNAVRGFGKSLAVMFFSVFGMIVCRQVFLFIAMRIRYDIRVVYLGYPVGWFFAALFVVIYYFIVIKKRYGKLADGVVLA
ncbi:MAG: MATE family efflux transporter [Oscillospiraceae bacterium]|nr:MATE family efflux transporter [Oscillospiraceae bacterium]